jgi:hypothetical protein
MRRRFPMPRWSPLGFLRSFTTGPAEASEVAVRWTRAFRAEPDLAADICRLGGLLATVPVRLEHGVEQPDPIDPLRLAYEAGRRDLALKLLAAGHLGQTDLNSLLESDDD